MGLDLPPSSAMPLRSDVDPPSRWSDFVTRKPRAIADIAEPVALRQTHIDEVRRLAIDGRRAYSPDPPGQDHWDDEPPYVDGIQTAGFDCENLALWIRRVMAERFDDWPLGCARPTICRLPDERWHCVLTIEAEGLGDYVVGSQHEEDFVPWRELEGYFWRSRLVAGNVWREIATE